MKSREHLLDITEEDTITVSPSNIFNEDHLTFENHLAWLDIRMARERTRELRDKLDALLESQETNIDIELITSRKGI